MSDRIPVSEIFGPTIQGEGPLAGQPCSFLRLGGCDYRCCWCDTPYAVHPHVVRALPRLTEAEIVEGIRALHAESRWVIFTGGNPALHNLTAAVLMLQAFGYQVQVETQGSLWKAWLEIVDMLVVSPKPPSARTGGGTEELVRFVNSFSTESWDQKKLHLKVVIFTDEDFSYAEEIHQAFPQFPFYLSCGRLPAESLDPIGQRSSLGGPDDRLSLRERYRWLAERTAASRILADARVLPQLHVYAWGEERGR